MAFWPGEQGQRPWPWERCLTQQKNWGDASWWVAEIAFLKTCLHSRDLTPPASGTFSEISCSLRLEREIELWECPQFVLHNWLRLLCSFILCLASPLPILLSSHLLKRSMWSMLRLLPDVWSSTSTERKKLVQYRLQDLDNSWGTYHQKQVTTCQGIVCTLHYFFLMTLSKPCSMCSMESIALFAARQLHWIFASFAMGWCCLCSMWRYVPIEPTQFIPLLRS